MSQQSYVVAVVVTWNRRDLLITSLRAVLAQTRPPDRVVVVDNASTDGTAQMLSADFSRRDFPTVDVVRSSRNVGGAGGFALGIRRALMRCPGVDAVWLLDDDTVPEPGALAALLQSRTTYPGPTPALVASRVVWTDGRDHPMNTPRRRVGSRPAQRRAADAAACTPVRSASFVSVLLDAAVIGQRGLPVADYFLWNDDFEYTTRLIRGNVGLLCPASVVVHHTRTFGSTDVDPGERFFYEVRNKMWLFSRSRGLSPLEKLGYAAASMLRWARTVASAPDRALLLRCLGRGLLVGIRTSPRSTDEVLAAVDVAESEPA